MNLRGFGVMRDGEMAMDMIGIGSMLCVYIKCIFMSIVDGRNR